MQIHSLIDIFCKLCNTNLLIVKNNIRFPFQCNNRNRKGNCTSNLFLYRIPTILKCFESGTFYFPPINQWLVDFLARYLAILNSSINFIIYCLVGSQFRNVLLEILGFKKGKNKTKRFWKF